MPDAVALAITLGALLIIAVPILIVAGVVALAKLADLADPIQPPALTPSVGSFTVDEIERAEQPTEPLDALELWFALPAAEPRAW